MAKPEGQPFAGVTELVQAAAASRITMLGRGKDSEVMGFLRELLDRFERDIATIDDAAIDMVLSIAEQNDNNNGIFKEFEEVVLKRIRATRPDAEIAKSGSERGRWQVLYSTATNPRKFGHSIRATLDGR